MITVRQARHALTNPLAEQFRSKVASPSHRRVVRQCTVNAAVEGTMDPWTR